jgi:VanZ family protein
MKQVFRPLPLLISMILMAGLYWGLSQVDARAIYASWDKILHAAVFFVIWWLLRWSLRLPWIGITLIAVLAGGAEEIHQLFKTGHQADWGDWYADVAGVAVALLIYAVGRVLWWLRLSVEDASAAKRRTGGEEGASRHAVDWRYNLKLWRWEVYLVLLGGHERRALTLMEQRVARWSVLFLLLVFSLCTALFSLLILYLLKLALGV